MRIIRRFINSEAALSGTVLTADGSGNANWVAPSAGSVNKGTAVVNFGAFPGSSDTSVAVTGQTGILSTSVVVAKIRPAASADHTSDEHWVEAVTVAAGNIVAGTGFTIYAKSTNTQPDANGLAPRLYGQWNVQWTWS